MTQTRNTKTQSPKTAHRRRSVPKRRTRSQKAQMKDTNADFEFHDEAKDNRKKKRAKTTSHPTLSVTNTDQTNLVLTSPIANDSTAPPTPTQNSTSHTSPSIDSPLVFLRNE